MGRPKKATPQPAVPDEEVSQEVPDEEEAVTEFNKEHADEEPAGGKVNKASAVRQALAAGHDSPEAGVAYLKKHFGIEMTKQVFSSNKAQAKAREAKKGGSTAPEPARKRAPVAAAPTPAPAAASSGAIPAGLFDDLKALKDLKEKYGNEFDKLVDLV